MDILTDLLSSVRLVAPLIASVEMGGDAAIEVPAGNRIFMAMPFHFVVKGGCRLSFDETEEILSEGELIILPHWPKYFIRTGACVAASDITTLVEQQSQKVWSTRNGLDCALQISVGTAPPTAVILSGIFAWDAGRQFKVLQDLPEQIRIGATGGAMLALLNGVRIFAEHNLSQSDGFAATASRLLEAVLIETLRTWMLERGEARGWLQSLREPSIAPALHAIHNAPGKHWTIATLAALCGQSRTTFVERFTASLHMPPARYIVTWRHELALRKLEAGERSIEQLAQQLGYGSALSFSRSFQRVMGKSPSKYRKEHLMPH